MGARGIDALGECWFGLGKKQVGRGAREGAWSKRYSSLPGGRLENGRSVIHTRDFSFPVGFEVYNDYQDEHDARLKYPIAK